jgi:hypothetical protein
MNGTLELMQLMRSLSDKILLIVKRNAILIQDADGSFVIRRTAASMYGAVYSLES